MPTRRFNWLANLNWFLRHILGLVLVEECEVDDNTLEFIKHNRWKLMTWTTFMNQVNEGIGSSH